MTFAIAQSVRKGGNKSNSKIAQTVEKLLHFS